MTILKVRGIYTINVAPDKKSCGYCDYCECQNYREDNPKFKCFLFKENLKRLKSLDIVRCRKCLKGEIKNE